MNAHRRRGLTLIELLIVIVGMTILAGVVVPHLEAAVRDARQSAMMANLYELTTAIERYKLEHQGRTPEIRNHSLPQLVFPTDASGAVVSDGDYGPYLTAGIPVNPLNDSARVIPAPEVPPQNPQQYRGWIYDEVTGQIWAGEKQ